MIIRKDLVPYNKNMKYGRFYTKILDDNRISPMAFRLLCVLMNCNTSRYHPTIKSLAKQFNVESQKIDRAVKELKKYGYLTSTGTRTNTVWNIHPITVTD
jgi:DNA-binding MarR family transcriptional regulator